jgi:hypothetical protein
MKTFVMLLFVVMFGLIWVPRDLSAASCPYCGKEYGEPAPGDEARVYELRRQHELTCPSRPAPTARPRARGSWFPWLKKYGAVTIFNETTAPINYEVKRTNDGEWEAVTVQPNLSHYHWQTLPAHFQIRFDSSSAPGYQAKSYDLDHNAVTGHEPTWQEGRAYTFRAVDDGIDLSASPSASRPSLPGFDVSLVGSGTGKADGPFGAATTASGTFSLDFMTRAAQKHRSGTWTARKVKDKFSLFSPYKSQEWVFVDDATGSEARGVIRGGAGTLETWEIEVPDDTAAGKVKVKFGVQFDGDLVRLLSFSKAF